MKVAPIVEKMIKNHLIWDRYTVGLLVHLLGGLMTSTSINLGVGEDPKLTWASILQKETKDCALYDDLAFDRMEW